MRTRITRKYLYLPQLALLILMTLVVSLLPTIQAAPNSLNSIEILVALRADGSARISETWDIEIGDGTEVYKSYGNLQDALISDFTVHENGILFANDGSWNTNRSREQKAQRSGINLTANAMELCWGFGTLGRHSFEIAYTVTNFVQRYSDYNGIYWQFVGSEMNTPPGHVRLEIARDGGFTLEDTRAWAFGFSGSWLLQNGKIVAESDRALRLQEFVELMVRLPLDYLESPSLRNQKFSEAMVRFFDNPNELLTAGTEGKTQEAAPPPVREVPSPLTNTVQRANRFEGIIPDYFALTFVILILCALGLSSWLSRLKKGFSTENLAGILRSDLAYDPDLNLGGDILVEYWLLKNSKECTEENLIQALLIRWLQQGYLKPLSSDENDAEFYLTSTAIFGSPIENQLYSLLSEAAGHRGVLTNDIFKDWCNKNGSRILDWTTELNNQAAARTQQLNYITEQHLFLFFTTETLTPQGKEELRRLLSLKKYLSRHLQDHINRDGTMERWNEYLFYANLLGISRENEDALRQSYPLGVMTYNGFYYGLPFLYGYSRFAYNANIHEYQRQMATQQGTGGFSGFGGGGISAGGGGGMGGGGGGGVR